MAHWQVNPALREADIFGFVTTTFAWISKKLSTDMHDFSSSITMRSTFIFVQYFGLCATAYKMNDLNE